MPTLILSGNSNVALDDIEQLAKMSAIIDGRLRHVQPQIAVLGVLLVVLALVILAITASDFYRVNYCGRDSRQECRKVVLPGIATSPYSTSPPPEVVVKSCS